MPDVTVLGVDDRPGETIGVHVAQAGERPACVSRDTPADGQAP
jgi:hypothetical protein